MLKALTEAQKQHYEEEGAVAPVRVFDEAQAASYLNALETLEKALGADIKTYTRTKPHLCLKWMDEIVNHPRVLDAVEDLLGPNLLVYNLSLWVKEAGDDSFVGWHQDSTYFPLDPAVQVTAWVALTPSDEQSGNVKYVAGSQRLGQLRHAAERKSGSLLSKGQSIAESFDASVVKSLPLRPGEMSLHHTRVVHFSEPNRATHRRIGLGISYIPTSVRCTGTVRQTAMLVRGVDEYRYFDHEPRVRVDFDPAVEAFRVDAIARYYRGRDEQMSVHESMYETSSE